MGKILQRTFKVKKNGGWRGEWGEGLTVYKVFGRLLSVELPLEISQHPAFAKAQCSVITTTHCLE